MLPRSVVKKVTVYINMQMRIQELQYIVLQKCREVHDREGEGRRIQHYLAECG